MQTKVIHVDPKTLKLLEMNARFMRHEEFQRLVANVKKDGQLTSAPFAARNAGTTTSGPESSRRTCSTAPCWGTR